eukprot:1194466-Prorocentrum_minimum.AAC.4
MANPQLWHFFGVCKDLGGELRNSLVVEWLNKGLMTVSSSTLTAGSAKVATMAAPTASSVAAFFTICGPIT